MTAQKNLGALLEHLLTTLSNQGNQQLTEVEMDLVQTSYLLAEAIEKLGGSFISIHEAVEAQHMAISTLKDGEPISAELKSTLEKLRETTAQHVNAAVTGLQFQDMTGQLIGRIAGHVSNLREVLAEMGSSGATLSMNSGDEAAIAVLESVNRAVDLKGSEQGGLSRKAVAQTHMGSGDIELF